MPFPWKKNRVTRFSQIVADLQSPKRGGSLVVETGFPTSLIDLFVKNRTRFRKSKSNKPVQPHPRFTHPPPPPPPPSPATSPPYQPSSTIPLPDETEIPGRAGECETGSGLNIGVAVLVKMFVVLVLIASVKRLTVGITVSAFALVFLEYAGKRVVSPSSDAKMESLSKRVSVPACVFWFQKLLQLKVKKGNPEVTSVQLGSIDEIEVVESKSEVGICCEENELDFDDDDESPIIKVVESCGISECKSKGSSRSGRFKSKMVKKLLPKKFRCSKKEKEEEKRTKEVFEAESVSEVSSVVDEHKLDSFEMQEEEQESSLLLRTRVDEEEVNYGITYSQESLLEKEEVRNEKRIDRVGNSSYKVLLVIALAGLVVGRVPALILTITWCLILKLVKTLWRSQNVPLIKCSLSKLLIKH